MKELKRWALLVPLVVLFAAAGCQHTHPTAEVTDLEARLIKIEAQLDSLTAWANGDQPNDPPSGTVNFYLKYVEKMVESYRDVCEKVLQPQHGYDCVIPPPAGGSDPPTGRPPAFP